MFSLIGTIVSGAFKLLTGGSVLDRIISIIDKKVPDEIRKQELINEATEKYLAAQVEIASDRRKAFGNWAWVMAALFLPGPALWWNMVFLDSVFDFQNYDVLALPTAFYPWMTSLIGALFFIPTVNNFLKK